MQNNKKTANGTVESTHRRSAYGAAARQAVLCGLVLLTWSAAGSAADEIAPRKVEALQTLILPAESDSQWMRVSWMPATDIWAARQKAAADGKPMLLWYMAGEPLGPC